MSQQPFYRSLRPFLHPAMYPRPIIVKNIFGNDNPIEVEIGFGNGEYLARVAKENPQHNFLGFEQYCNRVQRALRKVGALGLSNVRLMRLDVRAGFERFIAPHSITKVHCLYPTPWPKKSDAKHRLLNHAFLCLVNSRMCQGGEFLIVTDFKPYLEYIQEQLPDTGFELEFNIIQPIYRTKFEDKWAAEGQREFYQLKLIKRKHCDRPLKEDTVVQHYMVKDFNPEQLRLNDFSSQGISVAFKEFLYDPKQQIGLVYAIVTDDGVEQHIRIAIVHCDKGWMIKVAQGSMLMPTPSIAKALELVYQNILSKS